MIKTLLSKYHKFFILEDCILLLVFFLCPIFSGRVSQNVNAEEIFDDTVCCQCHNNMCQDAMFKSKGHTPFLKHQCSICHVCDETDTKEQIDTAVVKESFDKVTCLDYRVSPALEHWFVIPFDLVNTNKLLVYAYDVMSTSHKKTLLLPAIETIQLKKNDNIPPVIESIEVIRVSQVVLISAYIDWFTDKETDSEIRYGIETLEHSVKTDYFTTEHKVVIQGLQANQTYQYKVISKDIFGNIAESGVKLFSTEEISPNPPENHDQYQEKEFLLDTQVFQNDDSYILKFTSNIPIILSVATKKTTEEAAVPERTKVDIPRSHSPMRSRDKVTLSVCTKKCHVGFTHTGGHPVGVFPPEDATVPTDYSLMSDGRISCITCHANHASNNDHRLRFCYKGGKIRAGYYATAEEAQAAGGCLICHRSKGVLPKNRLKAKKGPPVRKSGPLTIGLISR